MNKVVSIKTSRDRLLADFPPVSSLEAKLEWFIWIFPNQLQCPSDMATLDIAATLPIATSTPVTDFRQYINNNLVYNDLKIPTLCSK